MLHLFKIQPEFADISAKKYNKEFAANKQLVSLKKVWDREKKWQRQSCSQERKKKHTVAQVTILLMNRDDPMERLL